MFHNQVKINMFKLNSLVENYLMITGQLSGKNG